VPIATAPSLSSRRRMGSGPLPAQGQPQGRRVAGRPRFARLVACPPRNNVLPSPPLAPRAVPPLPRAHLYELWRSKAAARSGDSTAALIGTEGSAAAASAAAAAAPRGSPLLASGTPTPTHDARGRSGGGSGGASTLGASTSAAAAPGRAAAFAPGPAAALGGATSVPQSASRPFPGGLRCARVGKQRGESLGSAALD
jgi:hypothetical protein